MTTPLDESFDDERGRLLAWLNNAEDLATAAEDAELVFEIMALKERLHLPTQRPSTPPN